MTMHLAVTAAGLAAIADADNVGTEAVQFRTLAIGAGTATGDQSARTALIDQKMSVALTGQASGDTRIAIRADYEPTENFIVTEVGLFARIGDDGSAFLFAYWVAENAQGALASAANDTALVVAGVVAIENSSAAITVTPALNIAIGVPDNVVLETDHATTTQRGIIELATAAEARAGSDSERAVTPAGLEARIGDIPTAVAPPNASTTRRGIVELATNAETQTGSDSARAVTPQGLASRTATTSRKGLVELATAAEARAGSDSSRAVTPAGLEARIGDINIPSAPGDATTDTKGIVELATDAETQAGTDGARAVTPASLASRTATETRTGLVELATTAEAQTGTDTDRAVTPAGVKAALDNAGRDGVLASAISLSGVTRRTQALSANLDGFRWLELLVGPDSGKYDQVVKVPRSAITQRTGQATRGLYALVGARTTRHVNLRQYDVAQNTWSTLGGAIELPFNSALEGVGMTEHDGVLYALALRLSGGSVDLYQVDPSGPSITLVTTGISFGQTNPNGGAAALFSHDDQLFVLLTNSSANGVTLYHFNLESRYAQSVRVLGGLQIGGQLEAVGAASHGGAVYMATSRRNTGAVQFWTLTPASGAIATLGREQDFTGDDSQVKGIGMTSHDGTLYAMINRASGGQQGGSSLVSVNPSTGATTSVSTDGGGRESIAMASHVVSTVSGGVVFDDLRLDRAGDATLGLECLSDKYVHQVIGVR